MVFANPAIAEMQFVCPHTSRLIDSGILTDADSLSKVWESTLRVPCPDCGKEHNLIMREAFLEHVLRSSVGGLVVQR